MTTIDERVVRMLFDNRQFEQNVSTTLGSLDKLNKGLKLDGAAKGLGDVASAAKNFSLQNIENGVDSIVGKFRTMSIVGITALTNIVNKAATAGINIVKSLSINPVKSGLDEYETNLNSIQTVMANTGLEGQKGLNKVNDSLNELNTYSDKTIYNFSEMARNIGTFTAAGVDLKTSTAAIKGIANLAAVSGSNSEQASTAMYQLSQALAAGKVSLMDWNSVVNAGMGGKVFQQSLMETARTHGVAIDQMVKDEGGFRNTLQKGWLTSDILTETLSKFTGDLSLAQIKSLGYTDKQAQKILKMGKTAQDAATKVKTMSQLVDTLKEAVGSGWTKTWQLIFGDFGEARTMFTNASNVLGGYISASANARNKVLGDWKALGGRKVLIDSISLAFHTLIADVKPLKDAFREIFPAKTGKDLYNLTKSFHVFIENLKISGETAGKLKRIFAGVFAIFSIGWDLIKGVAGVFGRLFKTATQGSGNFLEFVARLGDFFVQLRTDIKNGDGLTNFFAKLGDILVVPIKLVQKLGTYIGSLFDNFGTFDGKKAAKSVEGIATGLNPLQRLINLATAGGDKLVAVLDRVWRFLQPLVTNVVKFFSSVGQYIQGSLTGIDYGRVLQGVDTGLFAGLILLIRKFVKKFRNNDTGLSGIVSTIRDSFEELNKTMAAMQNTLKAATLLEIAAAIGILTISVVALSKIDPDALKKSLAAIAVMFAQLFASMAVFNKVAGGAGFTKMILVAGGLILIATAVDILVIAVMALSKLNWNELSKGLTGVTVLLAGLAGAVKLMPPASGMISTGLGLIAMAAAVNILVIAVTDLSGLSWKELSKGLVSVGVLLGSLALFTRFAAADKGGVLQGAGIILLAVAMKILASALKDFAAFSWVEIGKGLTVMAGGLTLIAGALYLIPPTSVFSAAGVLVVASSLGLIGDAIKDMSKLSWQQIGKGLTVLAGALVLISAALYLLPPQSLLSAAAIFVVAASLGMISDALKAMAGMSWKEIGKGLTVLAGSLIIISAAVILMTAALPGAAALLVVSASLLVLLPILQAFGNMSWEQIGKSLLVLAGVFVVLGGTALILAPLVPVLLGLGAAVLLLGVGFLAAGAGLLLFATGLTALSVAGAAGAAAIVGIVTALIGLIPLVMEQLGKGIVAFANVIITAGPAIFKAITVVLEALIKAIVVLSPRIITTLGYLLTLMLGALAAYIPLMVSTGLKLITGILNGIASNIGGVVTAATNVIVNFLNGISRNLPRIIQAGVSLIIAFINGLATAIRKNSKAMGDAGANLGEAIVEGMGRGLAGGVTTVAKAAGHLAQSAIDSAMSTLHINSPSKDFIRIGQSVNEGFIKGLTTGNRSQVDAAFDGLRDQLRTSIRDSADSINTLEDRLKRLTKARHKDNDAIRETRDALAQARKEHAAESQAYTVLTKNLTDEHGRLDKLSNQYSKLADKIKNAKDVLANAIKTRDDYNRTIKDQYDTLPDITGDTTVAGFEGDLKKQIDDTKKFADALQKLRKLGLSNTIYKDLLSKGTQALPFVQDLLKGGKASVTQVNNLGKQLDTVSASLGKTASTQLYQAAVDSAKGLVKGLQDQQAAIQHQMDKIADAMVRAIKKALGIHSPSTVFAEIGGYSAKGLVQGFDASTYLVQRSSAAMGDASVESLRKSLSAMSDLVTGHIDVRPTIVPVLDLSEVKKNAAQIGAMLTSQPVTVQGAYSKAQAIASHRMIDPALTGSQPAPTAPISPVTYNQYNVSPKTLSGTEIYRRTKNQLSQAKGALPTP